jgi:ABC-type histidine transport system ATPase subunit
VQSKRTMGVFDYAFARMVACRYVFLLQGQVANEVLLPDPLITESIVKRIPKSEADDVV